MTRTSLAVKNASLIAGAVLLVISAAALAAPDNNDKQQGRLLYGKVLDRQDNPVAGAIVYLTNTRTHAVKTYIVGQEGTYRFPGLSTVDYEVYAQYNGHKSDTKSVSQFDDRSQVYIDLRMDAR
jgi:Carboxypeptidase regulatory-like domain